jgi:hypothetical protein
MVSQSPSSESTTPCRRRSDCGPWMAIMASSCERSMSFAGARGRCASSQSMTAFRFEALTTRKTVSGSR